MNVPELRFCGKRWRRRQPSAVDAVDSAKQKKKRFVSHSSEDRVASMSFYRGEFGEHFQNSLQGMGKVFPSLRHKVFGAYDINSYFEVLFLCQANKAAIKGGAKVHIGLAPNPFRDHGSLPFCGIYGGAAWSMYQNTSAHADGACTKHKNTQVQQRD